MNVLFLIFDKYDKIYSFNNELKDYSNYSYWYLINMFFYKNDAFMTLEKTKSLIKNYL